MQNEKLFLLQMQSMEAPRDMKSLRIVDTRRLRRMRFD